jgi:uncharacterized protein
MSAQPAGPPSGGVNVERLASLMDGGLLELIVLPTEKCNFRCVYCYEDFKIGRMQRETVRAVEALIRRRADDLHTLYLSWFGGEPLLARDVVLEVSRFAAGCARERPHLSYSAGITTNAYLLDPETFAELAAAGVLDYQISLDGPQQIHDRSRMLAGGGGTFERIWGNLLSLRKTDAPARFRLRVHYDRDTAFEMRPLLDLLKRELLGDPRFFVHFHEIEQLGGPNDRQIKVVSPAERRIALEFLNRALYGDDFSAPEPPPYVCYAARPNSLLIRADGRVGKCTVALNDARNTIGTLNPDGTLALDRGRIQPWLRGLGTLDASVLECPLAGMPAEASQLPVLQRS